MSCEFCKSNDSLSEYQVDTLGKHQEASIICCDICLSQIQDISTIEPNHWRCLGDSMWSDKTATAMFSYVMLNRLKDESWSRDLLDMIYLEDEARAWGDEILSKDTKEDINLPKDSNGASLQTGDSVSVIKDLEVKGANFTVKRGTIVKNIYLNGNIEQVEGRVNGTQIVLLAKFLKKI